MERPNINVTNVIFVIEVRRLKKTITIYWSTLGWSFGATTVIQPVWLT